MEHTEHHLNPDLKLTLAGVRRRKYLNQSVFCHQPDQLPAMTGLKLYLEAKSQN